LIVSLAVLMMLGACSSTQTTGEEIDDAVITSKVKAKLAADPEVNPFEIDVDTLNRVVYLRGTVETRAAMREAEKLARTTSGVLGVVNELNLGDHTFREGLNDATLATKIKAKLAADPDINPFDIDVDADLGVITLHGQVRTVEQKREAEEIARGTDGVRKVRNKIEVSPRASGR
jgi:hyperosmotically inducible protein